MRAALAVLALAISALPVDVSHAQDAFDRISIHAGGAYNVNRSALHDFWEPGYGGEMTFATPFYLGEIETGAAVHRYDTQGDDVPRFDALLVHLGWGIDLSPLDPLSLHAGLHIGTYRMTFDEETFPGVRNESELTLGMQARLELHVTDGFGIYGTGRYMRTYTLPRFDSAYFSGGLRVTLESPRWLRTILR